MKTEKTMQASGTVKTLVGRLKRDDECLEAGDIIRWEEWWEKKDQWAEIIAVCEGLFTTHFRVRFEDNEMERWNQEDKEWFRLKHTSGANIYSPNVRGDSLPSRKGNDA